MKEEHSLEGIRLNEIKVLPDERGFFAEVLRQDWQSFIDEWITQVNMSYNYPNIVRAWHRHLQGQVDYFLVISGALKICGYDDETKKLVEIINIGKKPMLIRMPGHSWHG